MSLMRRMFQSKGRKQNLQKDIPKTVKSTTPKAQTAETEGLCHPDGAILEDRKALKRAAALNHQAQRLRDQEQAKQAHKLAEKALSLLEETFGKNSPKVATQLVFMGGLYMADGNNLLNNELMSQATAGLKKEEMRKTYDGQLVLNKIEKENSDGGSEENHRGTTVAEFFAFFAYAQAVPLCERALSIMKRDRNTVDPGLFDVVDQLGSLYIFFHLHNKALPLLKTALAIKTKALGPQDPEVAIQAEKLAKLYRYLGDFSKAISLLEKALPIKEQSLGPEHPDVLSCLSNLGWLYKELGDFAKEMSMYKRVLAISQNWKTNSQIDVPSAAEALIRQGQQSEGEELLKRFLSDMPPDWKAVTESPGRARIAYWNIGEFLWHSPLWPPGSGQKVIEWMGPSYSKAFHLLSFLAIERQDWSGAMTYIDQALTLEPEHPTLLCEKAFILSHTNHQEDAYNLLTKAAYMRSWAPPNQRANALRGAGIVLIDLNRLDEAEQMLQESLKIEPENELAKNELLYIEISRRGGAPWSDPQRLH